MYYCSSGNDEFRVTFVCVFGKFYHSGKWLLDIWVCSTVWGDINFCHLLNADANVCHFGGGGVGSGELIYVPQESLEAAPSRYIIFLMCYSTHDCVIKCYLKHKYIWHDRAEIVLRYLLLMALILLLHNISTHIKWLLCHANDHL